MIQKASKIVLRDASAYKRGFFFLVLNFVFSAALFLSCKTVPLNSESYEKNHDGAVLFSKNLEWTFVQDGVFCSDFENSEYGILYHVIKVDLSNPLVELALVPKSAHKAKDGFCVAVNATQFSRKALVFKSFVGICRIDGKDLSSPVEKYAAFAFNSSLEGSSVDIILNQSLESLEGWQNVAGGFFCVLKDGNVLPYYVERYDARTGAGLSKDKKTLYFLVAEGKDGVGLSYRECGLIFKELGCSDALEFDGGSSTALFINSRNSLSYKTFVHSLNAFGIKKAGTR